MNKWEKRQKYTLDMIDAMIKYAKLINPDTDSKEYQDALFDFATNKSKDYKLNWEKENGVLDDINRSLYERN